MLCRMGNLALSGIEPEPPNPLPYRCSSSHSAQFNNNNYCYTRGYCKTVIGREWETSASDPMTEPLNGESAVCEATRDRNLLKWSSGESASQGGQKASLHKHLSSRGFRHSVPPYKSLVHVAFPTLHVHHTRQNVPCVCQPTMNPDADESVRNVWISSPIQFLYASR
jgi:hypothetical protein